MPIEQLRLSEEKVTRVLESTSGNVTKAAGKLQVSAAWLSKWLARNGFERRITWEKKGGAA